MRIERSDHDPSRLHKMLVRVIICVRIHKKIIFDSFHGQMCVTRGLLLHDMMRIFEGIGGESAC